MPSIAKGCRRQRYAAGGATIRTSAINISDGNGNWTITRPIAVECGKTGVHFHVKFQIVKAADITQMHGSFFHPRLRPDCPRGSNRKLIVYLQSSDRRGTAAGILGGVQRTGFADAGPTLLDIMA